MANPTGSPGAFPTRWRQFHSFLARPWIALREEYSRRRNAEVFPWMEHTAAVVAAIGALVGLYVGRTHSLGTIGLAIGAIAGAIGGVLLALRWAGCTPGATQSPVPVTSELWDPWLDDTHNRQLGAPPETEAAADFDGAPLCERARVRPRVYSIVSGESLPIEDVIGSILTADECGAIRISGPDGSGKSTALVHLARLVPPYLEVSFFDGPDPQTLREASIRGRVVFATEHTNTSPLDESEIQAVFGWIPGAPKLLADLRLVPWGDDEWIEYLLAKDRRLCAPVMARLARADAVEQDFLGGIPELWTTVLDVMAADDSIEGPREALRIALDRHLDDPYYKRIEGDCVEALAILTNSRSERIRALRQHHPDEALFRLIRHRPAQILLAARRIADELAEGTKRPTLAKRLPHDLVHEIARQTVGRPEAIQRLRSLIASRDEAIQPMVASILHALRVGWKPKGLPPRLKGAYLEEASWAGVDLEGTDMQDADLSRADLSGARLDHTRFWRATMCSANLQGATLYETKLQAAYLSRARLAKARAERANFENARLDGADFEGALMNHAFLRSADLRGARFEGASLVEADLSRATVEGADFSEADLSGALMVAMKLTGAQWVGACFSRANLSGSDLEQMVLPNAEFAGANFCRALLTGSRMPNANFRGANFSGAGLAEVEWERADLRGANFHEAAFHLGSSRSGLVGSPIACEGSRTGFYTDEYNEQDFKSPETIRKANLCGADLRGAKLNGVDFYLVDLRGAKVDPEHVGHLRACGAILESRV